MKARHSLSLAQCRLSMKRTGLILLLLATVGILPVESAESAQGSPDLGIQIFMSTMDYTAALLHREEFAGGLPISPGSVPEYCWIWPLDAIGEPVVLERSVIYKFNEASDRQEQQFFVNWNLLFGSNSLPQRRTLLSEFQAFKYPKDEILARLLLLPFQGVLSAGMDLQKRPSESLASVSMVIQPEGARELLAKYDPVFYCSTDSKMFVQFHMDASLYSYVLCRNTGGVWEIKLVDEMPGDMGDRVQLSSLWAQGAD